MKDSRVRSDVKIGQLVEISEIGSQKTITGIVKEIITKEFSHPLGILVLLENGAEGRIKEFIDSKDKLIIKKETDKVITENLTQLEKERIQTSTDLEKIQSEFGSIEKNDQIQIDGGKIKDLQNYEEEIHNKKAKLESIEKKISNERKEFLGINRSGDFIQSIIDEVNGQQKFNQNLVVLERIIREVIKDAFSKITENEEWWKKRIPGDVKERARNRKNEHESGKYLQTSDEYDLIEYVDFGDYPTIIIQKDNWNEVFSKIFPKGSQYVLVVKWSELNKIRSDLSHSRILGENQKKRFEVYYEDMMEFLNPKKQYEN